MAPAPGGRDRDEHGRARNARPRDELGRPLPYGSAGIEPLPEDLVLPAAETLVQAQQLLDVERPFQAHEVLEARWKSCPPDERQLWQGLAQLAVGLTHLRRGNATGAAAVLARARQHLSDSAGPRYGVDVTGLCTWATEAVDAAGGPEQDHLVAPPRLTG
ncbi:MAG TPA: DUF309 domain-containing protein [Candidatus Nanopelagicales bacterium]|jgi:hypothetical protein|nr:DUF309 domain-containing protein [Candidatus Nanopelagicales bacterium]